MYKNITPQVFDYCLNSGTKIGRKTYNWLQRDYNQFYYDGYAIIIEGNMPDYAYDYINSHAKEFMK